MSRIMRKINDTRGTSSAKPLLAPPRRVQNAAAKVAPKNEAAREATISAPQSSGIEAVAAVVRAEPKSIVMQSLGQWGKQLAMRPHGRRVQQELDALLRQLPPEGVLVVNFEGVEMMDYSFADEALGAIFSRMSAKEYPNRYIVLATGEGELSEALLENVEVALSRREVAALVLPQNQIDGDADASHGAMPVVLRSDASGEWSVAGTLPGHLIDTLRAVMDKQQVTVRELADELNIDSATACNNRIARLHQLRLVRREAAIVPEGGRQYFYSSVI